MKHTNQAVRVIEAMRRNGGYATLGHLNRSVDFSGWKTKTPFHSIRRIVQTNREFFKIRPGLWALQESRESVLRQFDLKVGAKASETCFTHYYYQGIIVEIGNFKNLKTYIPPQDQNRKAISDTLLKNLAITTEIPEFSYPETIRRASTVDVIWFNEREMPDSFFEIEHVTDFQNSLVKFMDLRDFFAHFLIVSDKLREPQFNNVFSRSVFSEMRKSNRVRFVTYDRIIKQYTSLAEQVI
jgi:hypothetical protein